MCMYEKWNNKIIMSLKSEFHMTKQIMHVSL